MELTKKERVIISNQLKILEKLYPDEADEYANRRKAIDQGFKIYYIDIDDQELSIEACREVMDILNMYRAIINSYKKIMDKKELDYDSIKFSGFDGNNETKQFSFTRYLIHDLGYYQDLLTSPDLNSHWPIIDRYRRMLEIWKSYPDQESLTKAQIKELLQELKIS